MGGRRKLQEIQARSCVRARGSTVGGRPRKRDKLCREYDDIADKKTTAEDLLPEDLKKTEKVADPTATMSELERTVTDAASAHARRSGDLSQMATDLDLP